MPNRRVAEPYLIEHRGSVREVVCHRYIKGGVHRRKRDRHAIRHPPTRYVILVGLAALPLAAILTLPANVLPAPFHGRDTDPGPRTGRNNPAVTLAPTPTRAPAPKLTTRPPPATKASPTKPPVKVIPPPSVSAPPVLPPVCPSLSASPTPTPVPPEPPPTDTPVVP